MKTRKAILEGDRRRFISTIIPVCGLSCLSFNNLFGLVPSRRKFLGSPGMHKFQKEWTRTYEESFRWRYSYYIEIMEQFAKYMGRKQLLEMIQRAVDDSNVKTGPDNPDHTFRKYFQGGGDYFKNMMTWEVIEESDTVYQMKVTECLWTKIFAEKNATDIGYATVCYSDFVTPKLYHSKIKFQRTKSLMQGDKYCNHRWFWQD